MCVGQGLATQYALCPNGLMLYRRDGCLSTLLLDLAISYFVGFTKWGAAMVKFHTKPSLKSCLWGKCWLRCQIITIRKILPSINL